MQPPKVSYQATTSDPLQTVVDDCRSPLKAIRRKCLDCSSGSAHEVTNCPVTDCPLYTRRDGHSPDWCKPARSGRPGGNPEALRKAREKRATQGNGS